MPIINHGGSSAPSHGTVKPLTLEDRFRYDQVIANKRAKWELQQNLGSLEQVDLDYVTSQYKVYNYLTETNTQDLDAVTTYINNLPVGDRIGWKRGTLLGNDIFEAKIGDYEGRQAVIDFSKDKACQELKQNDPDLWSQYFYERSWSNAPDSSNNRRVPKLRLFQDAQGKSYKNIKENFTKQDHIPQEVKAIVTPYLEQMGVISESRDQDYYNAVGANILKIEGYDPINNDHMRRAMKAGAAIKSFYGDWMTDTTTSDGDRRIGGVDYDGAGRDGVYRYDGFGCALVLGD